MTSREHVQTVHSQPELLVDPSDQSPQHDHAGAQAPLPTGVVPPLTPVAAGTEGETIHAETSAGEPVGQAHDHAAVATSSLAARRAKAAETTVEQAVPEADENKIEHFVRLAARYPLISHTEVVRLSKEIEKGNLEAKEKLINSNLRLVISIARNYQGQGLPFGDLVQEGTLGLMRAAEKFDYRKGYRFSTYATIWVRQSLQRGLDNTGRTIRFPAHIAQRVRRSNRAERDFIAKYGYEPTQEELAAALDVERDFVEAIALLPTASTSLQSTVGEQDDTPLGDLLPDESAQDEGFRTVNETARSAATNRAVGRLPYKQSRALELLYGLGDREPLTLAQAARVMGITVPKLRTLQTKAERELASNPEYRAAILDSIDQN